MNPLFRALVSYAINQMPDLDVPGFVEFATKLISGSQRALVSEEWQAEEPPWYAELCDYQRRELGDDEYEKHFDAYRAMLEDNSVDALVPIAIHVRTEILLDNAPKPAYRLKDVHVVYHLHWEDGQRAEYNCRPFGPENLDLTVPVLTKLTQIFADQFGEALLRPGLDAFHDQVATPFDTLKFEEMVSAMLEYVNAMPADRREPYMQVYQRIINAFRPGVSPEITSPTAIDTMRKASTTTTLEWGEGPQDGGFHA